MAALGEPLLTLTTPETTEELLNAGGFRVDEDLGAPDVTRRYGMPCVSFERIVLARKPA